MTLDEIPAGARVLLDANILIYARLRQSEQCRRLLLRCGAREVLGAASAIAVAEFCHRRMMQEAQTHGLTGSNPARNLARNPARVRELTEYAREVEDLLAGDLALLALTEDDFPTALSLQREHGLLTNDSLHLAAGLRAGLRLLATSDPQFSTVPGLTLFMPDDIQRIS